MSDKPNIVVLFEQAMLIVEPDARAQFVSNVCGRDDELRGNLERLLSAATSPAGPEDTAATTYNDGDAPAADGEATLLTNFSVLESLTNSIRDVPRVTLRESSVSTAQPESSDESNSGARSRYRLDGEIARGGMGAIIKGRDTDLGRDLAIKVLLDSHKDEPDVIQRFVEEAQIGGQLQHPGIAPVYELGQFADQRPFFSMKLVKGQTLHRLLADRKETADTRAKFVLIFEQVCQTVAYAHSRGVIHRDLKPANIMVGAFGEVQVMDWGLAKVLPDGGVPEQTSSEEPQEAKSIIQTSRSGVHSGARTTRDGGAPETRVGSVMGTPAYMPPEQALGEIGQLDERADVFGLGAILCEILTGKPPYSASTETRVFAMASRGKIDDCFERLNASDGDAALITIARRCLAPDPEDRPRDAGVLAAEITSYVQSVEAKLRETEKQRAAEAVRADESRKRSRVMMILAATILLSVSVGGAGWRWMELQNDRHRDAATRNVHDRLGDARLHEGRASALDLSSDEGLQEQIRELGVALESARDAVNLSSADDIDSALRETSGAMLARIEAELRSAEKAAEHAAVHRTLELDLQRIRASRAGGFIPVSDPSTAAPDGEIPLVSTAAPNEVGRRGSSSIRYRNAFRRAGLDLTRAGREQAVEWVRESPIREAVIGALDDWCRAEVGGEAGIPPELASITWDVLPPTMVESPSAKLERTDDDSVVAGPSRGAGEETCTYTVAVESAGRTVAGLRLEVLAEASLSGRLSHHESGNFHLRELRAFLRAEDGGMEPIRLVDAVASYSWFNRPVVRSIDGNLTTEWHVWQQQNRPQTAIFLLDSPIELDTGQSIVLELQQPHRQTIARFRVSAAGDSAELVTWRRTSRSELRSLADAADDSEWRRRIRAALASNDIEVLLAMAGDVDVGLQSPAMIARLGAGLRQSWEFGAAVELLRAARGRHPGDFWLNYELGLSLARPGLIMRNNPHAEEGRGYLRTAVALRPESLIALRALNQSVSDGLRQRPESASDHAGELLALAERIHVIDPNAGTRHFRALVTRLDSKGELEAAENVCRVWLERAPDSAAAHLQLGGLLQRQSQLAGSIAAFQRAIELNPKQGAAHNRVGVILANPNALTGATQECQRLVATYDTLISDGTEPVNWITNRAQAHLVLQNWESAKADWSRVIALKPEQVPRAFRAFCLVEHWSGAAELGLPYTETNPESDGFWLPVASVLVLAGEKDEYTDFCERAFARFGSTTSPAVSERITRMGLLLPDAVATNRLPSGPFIKALESSSGGPRRQSWFWATRALLAYRNGDARAAADYARRANTLQPLDLTRVVALAVISLAEQQLGHTSESSEALEQAKQLLKQTEQSSTRQQLSNRRIARILCDEANAAIDPND